MKKFGKYLGESKDNLDRTIKGYFKDGIITIVYSKDDNMDGVIQSCSIKDIKGNEDNYIFTPYMDFYSQVIQGL